jgi:hypothetical protein
MIADGGGRLGVMLMAKPRRRLIFRTIVKAKGWFLRRDVRNRRGRQLANRLQRLAFLQPNSVPVTQH